MPVPFLDANGNVLWAANLAGQSYDDLTWDGDDTVSGTVSLSGTLTSSFTAPSFDAPVGTIAFSGSRTTELQVNIADPPRGMGVGNVDPIVGAGSLHFAGTCTSSVSGAPQIYTSTPIGFIEFGRAGTSVSYEGPTGDPDAAGISIDWDSGGPFDQYIWTAIDQ